ncbi:MAG: protein-disulfide reductase DsbD N-terminal domain-containing protein [bacterium]|nr:protein-disulfide reductase DsbD N-terminal domain-containing protein [bacterium]
MRVDHEIFHSPNEVALTIEQRPTPDAYGRYGLGETMAMWRVQTEGYTEGSNQLIGVVSSNAGFADSPDTEWISGGVNTKRPLAIALGRHGNLFHWGFAASPTYMTEEARLVFVNAIHYIAKFAGQAPIARKQSGILVRSRIEEALAKISESGYAKEVEMHRFYQQRIEQRNAEIRARIAAGDDVTDSERRLAKRPPPKPPGRFTPVKRYLTDDEWQRLDGDEAAIREHFAHMLPFLHPEGRYNLAIDQDLRRFGVGNNDPAFLERAIAALREPEQAKLARTLLTRYTNEKFETAEQWTAWLTDNRERFFFTEAGGFKWLVDTRGAEVVVDTVAEEPPMPTPSNADPLVGDMTVRCLPSGNHCVTVRVAILPGWHGYKSVPEGSAYAPLKLTLELPDGVSTVGEWQSPLGMPSTEDPTITVYEGDLEFTCEIAGTLVPGREIACNMSYQVCDERMCLPPDTTRWTARSPR